MVTRFWNQADRAGLTWDDPALVPNVPEFKVRRTPENWAPVQAYGRGSWLEMSPRAHLFPIDSGIKAPPKWTYVLESALRHTIELTQYDGIKVLETLCSHTVLILWYAGMEIATYKST